MGKNKFFVPLVTFGMLLTALAACGGNNSNPQSTSNGGNTQADSSQAGDSTTSGGAGASTSSSQQQQHTHSYAANPSSTVKNADGKNVKLFPCSENDGGKLMTIAFGDYSEKSADFSNISGKYDEVPQAIKDESYQLAANSTISWKVNVDKAVTGAKLYVGAVATSSGHNTSKIAEKCKVKINTGDFAAWDYTDSVTYKDVGLNQTQRANVYVTTFNLVEGENTITLQQGSKGDRLLYGGDVRIEYEGEANPVAAPATGYNITFAPAAHCKVKVYVGESELVETNKTQSVNTDEKDADMRFVPAKYVAPVEDDPATAEDETVAEIKPEVLFKLEFDDGYTADGNDITVSGTMGTEWNKLCSADDDDSYNITKIKADITVTIAVRAITGSEPKGYVGTFNVQHGTLIVYQGEKKSDGSNVDTADANGKYYSRVKKGSVSKTKAQFNFEIIPDSGYEFVSGLKLGGESSPIGVTSFVTGNFGNFKRNADTATLYSITKIASDIVLNVVCTPIQG